MLYDVDHYFKDVNLERSAPIDNRIAPATVALRWPSIKEFYVYYSICAHHAWRYFEAIFFCSLYLLIRWFGLIRLNRDP